MGQYDIEQSRMNYEEASEWGSDLAIKVEPRTLGQG